MKLIVPRSMDRGPLAETKPPDVTLTLSVPEPLANVTVPPAPVAESAVRRPFTKLFDPVPPTISGLVASLYVKLRVPAVPLPEASALRSPVACRLPVADVPAERLKCPPLMLSAALPPNARAALLLIARLCPADILIVPP